VRNLVCTRIRSREARAAGFSRNQLHLREASALLCLLQALNTFEQR
jgi:hypothetical protein